VTATKIAFGLLSATNIAVWSILGWIVVERTFSMTRPVFSSGIWLFLPGMATLVCALSMRFKKYDLGGAVAFAMLFAALPFALLLGGGV